MNLRYTPAEKNAKPDLISFCQSRRKSPFIAEPFWSRIRIGSFFLYDPFPSSLILARKSSHLRQRPHLHHNTRVGGDTLLGIVSTRSKSLDDHLQGQLTGQSSAASFPTGPVMADPFISPLGLTI